MKNKYTKLQLLSSAPVSQSLLAMGLPICLGMLINALYNLADAYFVSGLGKSQLGAISVVFPLSQVVVSLGLMFGSGAASCLPRLLGAGSLQEANRTASTALYGSLLAGAAIISLFLLSLRPVLHWLGATPTIMPYALPYAKIYLAASIFNIFNVTMNNIASSEGAAKTTMSALLLSATLNIILDPFFIYQLGFGISGAAIATAISQMFSSLIYFAYIIRGKSVFSFSVQYFSLNKAILTAILGIGLPTMFFQLLTSLSISLINQAAQPFGDAAIAALGAVSRITAMETLLVFGFLQGFQPLAGFSYGAANLPRLKLCIKTALRWSNIFCLAVGLLTVFLAEPIIAQFASNADGNLEITSIGTKALQASGISFIFFGFYTLYSSLLLALGKAKAGMLLGACRQGICFIPIIWLLPKFGQLNGLIYAQPLADIMAAIITLPTATWLHKQINRIEKNSLNN